MTKPPLFGPSAPEGFITKKQAAELLGVGTKSIERLCKASQQSECRIRWMMVSNHGTRSITVYHQGDLMKYAAMPRVTKPPEDQKLDREVLFAHLDETLTAMNGLAQSAIGRGSRTVRLDMSTGRGVNRIRVSLEIGHTE